MLLLQIALNISVSTISFIVARFLELRLLPTRAKQILKKGYVIGVITGVCIVVIILAYYLPILFAEGQIQVIPMPTEKYMGRVKICVDTISDEWSETYTYKKVRPGIYLVRGRYGGRGERIGCASIFGRDQLALVYIYFE